MRPIREAIQKKRAAGPSMGLRLLLYRFIMVLLLMAAILSTLMATGVLSIPRISCPERWIFSRGTPTPLWTPKWTH